MHDVPMDVGQTEVASLVSPSQTFVIDAKEVETGGMKVVDVNLVFDNPETELIG